jgi:hypothetical protein
MDLSRCGGLRALLILFDLPHGELDANCHRNLGEKKLFEETVTKHEHDRINHLQRELETIQNFVGGSVYMVLTV